VLACYALALFVLGIDASFYLFDENNYWKVFVLTTLIILGLYFQICTPTSAFLPPSC